VQVRDFCSRHVVTVEPLASLREASLLMRNRHVGTLVVVDGTSGVVRPVGIVTDRAGERQAAERRPLDIV
jgi:CBS domain-containing protein